MIDFFDLNGREQLHRERARMIMLLGASLAAISEGTFDGTDEAIVQRCTSSEMPHAACLRAFRKQWENDLPFARRIHAEAKRYFISAAGELPAALAH